MVEQILEGTWEEVAQHAEQLSGKKVRLIVLGETQPPRPLAEALAGIVGALDSTDGAPSGHSPTPFSELIAEKFRKQGLRIP